MSICLLFIILTYTHTEGNGISGIVIFPMIINSLIVISLFSSFNSLNVLNYVISYYVIDYII